ncbi:MAG: glutathione S-transferase [Rhodomicrobium sp.]|nr:MAG: glutathione S-transferase [Rhodomicrobium sp.]
MHHLYSFRRCPYAMRARLAIAASGLQLELREVVLRDKPAAMLALSPKGTVPVLQTQTGVIIEESLDIALWALKQNDPDKLMVDDHERQQQIFALIRENDGPFKHHLDRTKYGTRYPDEDPAIHRAKASKFLFSLNERLSKTKFLMSDQQTLADITIAPFIRQFANSDRPWFNAQPWPHLINYLEEFLNSDQFQNIMTKYAQWQEGDAPTYFPETPPQTND